MNEALPQPPGAVVVFGAAGGIGGACAGALLATGLYTNVISVDRLPVAGTALHVNADVADPADRERALQAVLAWPERISALVYAIGATEPVEVNDSAWPVWQRILDVNFTAAAHILCVLHERVVRDATAVVVVDSTAADTGSMSAPPYAAAKAACRILTRSLALRTGASGARYNSLAPGPIDTKLGARLAERLGTTQQTFAERTIARRLGRPEEVAAAAVYLCGPGATFVNGTVLAVDGGFLAG